MNQELPFRSAKAILYRWSDLNGNWDMQYSRITQDEDITSKIIAALTVNPVLKMYKWECYSSDGILRGVIYTVNTSLF